MADKYDDAIEWLVANPTSIEHTWAMGSPVASPRCLFQFCTPSGGDSSYNCGCLTMIRDDDELRVKVPKGSGTRGLTREIRNDERLPASIHRIAHLRGDELRAALTPFAEWQRRLDKEIRTTKD